MHALVIERVMRLAEDLLERFAAVQRGIVLAGHQVDGLHIQLPDLVAHLRHPHAPLLRIVGRMG